LAHPVYSDVHADEYAGSVTSKMVAERHRVLEKKTINDQVIEQPQLQKNAERSGKQETALFWPCSTL